MVQNIVREKDYSFENNVMVLDYLDNHYDAKYVGKLDQSKIRLSIIKKGYLLFPLTTTGSVQISLQGENSVSSPTS